MTKSEQVGQVLAAIRAQRPLIHNITNYVVMNTTANALLAVGASPAMVHAVEEVEEFVTISSALVVNIGTLSRPWIDAMHLASARASAAGKPWVLDPVGAGATGLRTETARSLLGHRPTVVRGNGSEIMALVGGSGTTRGVDSTAGSNAALDSASTLARETGAVVAVSGVIDYVTDGERVLACANGDVRMTAVTGLGCTLSALTAACLAVEQDRMLAVLAACALLGVVGELAAEASVGPGSLQTAILDGLGTIEADALAARARLS